MDKDTMHKKGRDTDTLQRVLFKARKKKAQIFRNKSKDLEDNIERDDSSVSIAGTTTVEHIEHIVDHVLVTTTSTSEDEEMIYYPSPDKFKDDVSTTLQNGPLNVEVSTGIPSPENEAFTVGLVRWEMQAIINSLKR
jgi:hypothetical protein